MKNITIWMVTIHDQLHLQLRITSAPMLCPTEEDICRGFVIIRNFHRKSLMRLKHITSKKKQRHGEGGKGRGPGREGGSGKEDNYNAVESRRLVVGRLVVFGSDVKILCHLPVCGTTSYFSLFLLFIL